MPRPESRNPDKCVYGKYDCFAYTGYGKCKACSDTRFKGECPFYKTAAQRWLEHNEAMRSLKDRGMNRLIRKYGDDQSKIWKEIV